MFKNVKSIYYFFSLTGTKVLLSKDLLPSSFVALSDVSWMSYSMSPASDSVSFPPRVDSSSDMSAVEISSADPPSSLRISFV